MKINLINNFGIGDVHISRSFVSLLVDNGFDCTYYHRHPPHILKDISVKSALISSLPEPIINQFGLYDNTNDAYSSRFSRNVMYVYDNELYINTWVECSKYCDFQYSIVNFDAIYHLFEFFGDQLKINIPDKEKILPKINYSKINKDHVLDIVKSSNKRVLVCNEDPKSGQSFDFNFEVFHSLAQKFSDVTFFFSNNFRSDQKNILNVGDLLGYEDNILEVSYLSTFCDVIFSRCSGVSTCTLNTENILSKGIKYICYSKYMELPYFYSNQKNVLSLVGDQYSVVSSLYSIIRNL